MLTLNGANDANLRGKHMNDVQLFAFPIPTEEEPFFKNYVDEQGKIQSEQVGIIVNGQEVYFEEEHFYEGM